MTKEKLTLSVPPHTHHSKSIDTSITIAIRHKK